MQNQENKNSKEFNEKLSNLRKEIDDIDIKILDLLKDRFGVVENVKKLKDNENDDFYIKSAREADMIRNLINKSGDKLPKSLIVDIWRKIISFSNCSEQELKIALHNPDKIPDLKHILRFYYNDEIPVISHDTVSTVVMELESKKSQIAIFALPKDKSDNIDRDWWISLANNTAGIKVFAKIPMIEGSFEYNLVALAIKEVEKSDQDSSLLCIETSNEVRESQFLEDLSANFEDFKVLKSSKSEKYGNNIFYLVEIKGFLEEKSEKIENFKTSESKPYVKILGVYPQSIG